MSSNGPLSRCAANGEPVLTEAVVKRLDQEFRGSVHRGVIRAVVLGSHRDLDYPTVEALPELVERLARERLLECVARS
jgi:hypothetical protein